MGLSVVPVEGEHDLDHVRALVREYATSLDIDLAFQGFDAELATLPGRYAWPRGALFLARDTGGQTLGCVGVRPIDRPGACEVKRLYVRPEGRGNGAGLALANEAVAFAAATGYRDILLDTLPHMRSAISLYRALGFQEIAPYSNNPVPDMIYFGKRLRPT